ncbi:right-handed parallel beta-helix repeat-containing protein [Chryseobacterium foetidum]|uniref:right-handed parallel beta-helix repeat-containing protein n=1 Tax=Chryseobacterium foetidum TaxID=2951057 RepID=UPI0021CA3EC3|nr:right-handed parallel beta-helix repeat-containing protein [Chryseobacterium foetidum]
MKSRFCLNLILVGGLFFLSLNIKAQEFTVTNVPVSLVVQYLKTSDPNISKIKNLFPADKKFRNSKDHTAVVQKIIDANKVIVLPDFKIFINSKGLKIGSDKKIIFRKNSAIQSVGFANGRFSDVVKIYNAENVEIVNAVIVGNRYSKTKSQTGQWSAGISVLNSKNIKVTNAKISNTFGDGIFIGSEDGGFSENVVVESGWINKARRNGISVTSAKNVVLKNILISNTYGHDPQCGVDIEPSWEKDVLNNISLKNIYTFHNQVAGIAINLNEFNRQKASDIKTVDIVIENHTDEGSRHGFLTSLNTDNLPHDAQGLIKIKNAEWKQNQSSYWFTPNKHSINIEFSGIEIQDLKQKTDFESKVKNLHNVKLISE